MIHAETSTQIGRPRSEVFDFITNLDNFRKWQAGVTEVKPRTAGSLRAGFQFAASARVGPWNLNTVSTVTDFKPSDRFAFQVVSSGPIDCDVSFDLQPVAGGTRVTLTGRGRLKGFWQLLQPMLASELRKETRAELATIKLLLEGASVPSAVAV